MRRPKEPWYRKFNDTWYVTLNGDQIPLAKGKENKAEAVQAFYKLMALDNPIPKRPQQMLVITILDLFLDYSQKHNSKKTYDFYRMYLQDFSNQCGLLAVDMLKPFHVTRWLDAHESWKTARRCAITAVKRAFNWATDEGLIDNNPIKRVKKPPMPRRERLLTAEEQQRIFDAYPADDPFRDFLTALAETGARPGEIAAVDADMVNLDHGVWILGEHKTKGKTQKPRIIYLTSRLLGLTKRLLNRYPTGLLFRNTRGRQWTQGSIICRFRRVREKLGLGNDVVAYLYRHGFATNALENGVPVASVAELLGHQDLKMVAEHYSHLSQKRKHLLEMAKQATKTAT